MMHEVLIIIHDYRLASQIELKAPTEVGEQCPLKSFKFFETKKVDTGFDEIKKGHLNTRTPWW